MKSQIKQALGIIATSSLLIASPAAIADNRTTCELGKVCNLGLASKVIFPIKESGAYFCEVSYFGTQVALQDHEAVLLPGVNTKFQSASLDIEGDEPTQVNAIIGKNTAGELIIKSSDYTLYFDATALCFKG